MPVHKGVLLESLVLMPQKVQPSTQRAVAWNLHPISRGDGSDSLQSQILFRAISLDTSILPHVFTSITCIKKKQLHTFLKPSVDI